MPLAAVIVVFVAGLALAAASLNAIFRDVEFVVTAALLPWFFLTPVLYQLEDLPGADERPWLVDLLHWGNPVTPAIEAYRAPLYAGELPSLGDTDVPLRRGRRRARRRGARLQLDRRPDRLGSLTTARPSNRPSSPR